MRRVLYAYRYSLIIFLLAGVAYGQPAFSEISVGSGIDHRAVASDFNLPAQGGAAWFDFDKDGDEDLYLTGGAGSDALFRNEGNGSFTDITSIAGFGLMDNSFNTMGVITGDIDNDGFREVFITTEDSHSNFLFYNNGDGTFRNISFGAGVYDGGSSASASFGDYNLDGYLDLYVTNWCPEFNDDDDVDTIPAVQNYFYHNNGDMTFTEISESLGISDSTGCSLGVLFTDFDNDRDPDLMIANDFGQLSGNNEIALFRNDFPIIQFTDISEATSIDIGMNGMGMAHGDYDEDGDIDYYITNVGNDALLRNDGNSFSNEIINSGLENDSVLLQDLSEIREGFGWGCGFFDYDNDTDLDLFVSNGDIWWGGPNRPTLDSNKLFRNNGDGTFTDVSKLPGIFGDFTDMGDPYISRAFAYCDYDNDGDIDLMVGITDSIAQDKHSFLYRNNAISGNWLKVSLVGIVANRDGFGSRVEVMFNGRKLIREVDGGSSFNSHHSSVVHFGLADVSQIDTLRVIWPGGYTDEFYQINTNQHLVVTEQSGYVVTGKQQLLTPNFNFVVYPNPSVSDYVSYVIRSESQNPLSFILYDPTGRKIELIFDGINLQDSNSSTFRLPQHLTSGIYHLVLTDGTHQVIRKLSVIR